jgi:hypothetical protein
MVKQAGLLHPIGADSVRLRTSLYTDDTAIFLRPIGTDVEHLQQLLSSFGTGTGLCTNILKSDIVPIRCDDIHLPNILWQFQATLTSLPCWYLGLALHLGKLHRDNEQALIDKVASKLPNWKGRLLNKAGRLALANSVLSSIVVYHMTVFCPSGL